MKKIIQFHKKKFIAGCVLSTCLIFMLLWYLGPLKYVSAYVVLHARLKFIDPPFSYEVSDLSYYHNPDFDAEGYSLNVTGEQVDDQFSISWDNFHNISDTYQYDIINKEQTIQRLKDNYYADVLRLINSELCAQERIVLDFGGTSGTTWMQETFVQNMDYSKSLFDALPQHFGFHVPVTTDIDDLVLRLQYIQEVFIEKGYPITIFNISLYDLSDTYVFSNITPNDLTNQLALRLTTLLQQGSDASIQFEKR